ncbi:MAG: LamG domain-containing protein, partial [Candidatus Poribacteria bacterium]|nr:LamG domain-containing protein [Candidatus Poribacteria bacterium]
VSDGKWHFVAGGYDEKNLIPYVDGEQFNPRGAAGKPATNNAPFIIGAQGPDGKNGPLRGVIDEVAVYNIALDEDEITEVMEGLAKQFQAVEASEKLAVTWGYLKDNGN